MKVEERLNQNILIGKTHEKFIYGVVKSLFPNKDGYEVEHQDWMNYGYGEGVDIRVYKRINGKKKPFIAIESKGWNEQKRSYGIDTVENEILDRFRDIMNFPIKICVITFINLLTQKARDFLTNHNIQLVEIGEFISSLYESFKSASYYTLKSNILKAIKNITKSNPQKKLFGISSLVNYFTVNSIATDNTIINDNDNIKNLTNKINIDNKIINYDTPISSSNIINKSSYIINKLMQLATKNTNNK